MSQRYDPTQHRKFIHPKSFYKIRIGQDVGLCSGLSVLVPKLASHQVLSLAVEGSGPLPLVLLHQLLNLALHSYIVPW